MILPLTALSKLLSTLNPLKNGAPYHIEASQLIYRAYQFTGFYKMGNIGCKWVNIAS